MPATDSLAPHLETIRLLLADRVNDGVNPATDPDDFIVDDDIQVVTGQEAIIAHCCPAGYAWLRVEDVYPSTSFPNRSLNSPCPPPFFVAQVQIGVARCSAMPDPQFPTNDPRDFAPEPEHVIDEATQIGSDRAALIQLIFHDLPRAFDSDNIASTGVLPLANSGGCVGNAATLYLAYAQCHEDPEVI